jgi:hypothetical protein
VDDARDPDFIRTLLPFLDAALSYFDPEITGFERIFERGPMLIVGNHSGGIYMPDFWAFVRHWVRERGPVVLSRGEAVSKPLGLDRLRVTVLPVVAGLPWGGAALLRGDPGPNAGRARRPGRRLPPSRAGPSERSGPARVPGPSPPPVNRQCPSPAIGQVSAMSG